MVCPKCQNNTIPFFKTWARSGIGTYTCPGCGAVLRVRKDTRLLMGSFCLGLIAAGLGVYYQSWVVLVVATIVALVLDALLDFCCRRLELKDK